MECISAWLSEDALEMTADIITTVKLLLLLLSFLLVHTLQG